MIASLRQATSPLPVWVPGHVAAVARDALLAELATWPKPGLVSHVDNGSHGDMDAGTFEASTAAVTPYFAELTEAGAGGADMPELRRIGIAAERAMLEATGGVNTHRGAIFGLGLLCAAAGAAGPGNWQSGKLTRTVRQIWGDSILRGPIPLRSHGTDALRRFGAGGARAQAAAGFPLVVEIGLPALRAAQICVPDNLQAAQVQAFFALLAAMEDTNLLHRGGAEGLRFAQQQAADFLRDGGVTVTDWPVRALQVHHRFITRRLSPGGCADLLAITLFLDALETTS